MASSCHGLGSLPSGRWAGRRWRLPESRVRSQSRHRPLRRAGRNRSWQRAHGSDFSNQSPLMAATSVVSSTRRRLFARGRCRAALRSSVFIDLQTIHGVSCTTKFGQSKQTVPNTAAVPASLFRVSSPGRNHRRQNLCHFGRRAVRQRVAACRGVLIGERLFDPLRPRQPWANVANASRRFGAGAGGGWSAYILGGTTTSTVPAGLLVGAPVQATSPAGSATSRKPFSCRVFFCTMHASMARSLSRSANMALTTVLPTPAASRISRGVSPAG